MSIRQAARLMEDAALDLSRRGRGFFGHRERHVHLVIEEFVAEAREVAPGGVLPHEVRENLQMRIDATIEALETYVSRNGAQSTGRAMHDSGVVRQIYALREAQQHLIHTPHLPGGWARPVSGASDH